MRHGKILYLIWWDVDPKIEDKWNKWMNEVHVPDVVKAGGFLGARRFVVRDGNTPCRYAEIYEVEDTKALKVYFEGPAKHLRQDAAKNYGDFMNRLTRVVLEEVYSFENR